MLEVISGISNDESSYRARNLQKLYVSMSSCWARDSAAQQEEDGDTESNEERKRGQWYNTEKDRAYSVLVYKCRKIRARLPRICDACRIKPAGPRPNAQRLKVRDITKRQDAWLRGGSCNGSCCELAPAKSRYQVTARRYSASHRLGTPLDM